MISYLTYVNKNITVLLMNRNVITYSQNIRLSLTQVWIRMSHPRHSVVVTLSRVSGDRA